MLLHGDKVRDPGSIGKMAKNYLQEFHEAPLRVSFSVPGVVAVGAAKSTAPEERLFKINVDGSWSPDSGSGGLGGIIRDWKGEVIRGFAMQENPCCSALHTEILAVLRGLDTALGNRKLRYGPRHTSSLEEKKKKKKKKKKSSQNRQ
ncbi:hypothetical protein F0562_032400 [Nyssa sinensis]|uniref:RNase H type-1 domain-containing protein n=1 Tax=Nyssa sinensis TaxID=561372 RepID=A0A5J5AMK7_9ASTE|nr:hypothetical protein F0562_032400 [Nyssa sinensis]